MIHKNVERIRAKKGVTKSHVANCLGMSLMGYSHIEAGKVRLDVERLKSISKILNTDVCIFFDNKLTESVIRESNLINHRQ